MAHSLDALHYTELTAWVRLDEPALLPPFKGSTLRGALGHALRDLACPCPGDAHAPDCLFAALFDTRIPPDTARLLRLGGDAPRPYLVVPPLTHRRSFPAGHLLPLRLLLVGRAVAYWGLFAEALARAVHDRGLGIGLHRGTLHRLYDDAGTLLWDEDEGAGDLGPRVHYPWLESDMPAPRRLVLHFLTPTALRLPHPRKGNVCPKDLARPRDLERLLYPLAQRLHHLCALYCDERVTPPPELPPLPGRLKMKATLRPASLARHSLRQQRRLSAPGVLGHLVLQGELGTVARLLRAGAPFHVGKYAALGYGRFEVYEGPAP